MYNVDNTQLVSPETHIIRLFTVSGTSIYNVDNTKPVSPDTHIIRLFTVSGTSIYKYITLNKSHQIHI